MSDFVYFTGKCKWAMLKTPDKKYPRWKINVYFDEEGLEHYHETGLVHKIKEDEDGSYVTFKRPVEIEFKRDGIKKIVVLKPPVVFTKDRTTPLESLVGNGSTVTVKLETYKTKDGLSSRLVAVVVEDLVPFEDNPDAINKSRDLPF